MKEEIIEEEGENKEKNQNAQYIPLYNILNEIYSSTQGESTPSKRHSSNLLITQSARVAPYRPADLLN